MPESPPSALRHLNYSGRARREQYTAKGGGGGKFAVFPRRLADHARKLQGELQVAQHELERIRISQELAEYTEDAGINLEIRGEPDYPLNLEALDAPKFGISLKNVRSIEVTNHDGSTITVMIATVFVEHNKLSYLIKRVEEYAGERTEKGRPKHEKLVANISAIGLAAIEAFWTSKHLLPELDTDAWWEVWIRGGASAEKRALYEQALESEAQRLGIERKA